MTRKKFIHTNFDALKKVYDVITQRLSRHKSFVYKNGKSSDLEVDIILTMLYLQGDIIFTGGWTIERTHIQTSPPPLDEKTLLQAFDVYFIRQKVYQALLEAKSKVNSFTVTNILKIIQPSQKLGYFDSRMTLYRIVRKSIQWHRENETILFTYNRGIFMFS